MNQHPFHVPLDEYLAKIAELPMPTDQQMENFCRYVMHDHSWYKGSILQGTQFVFYLTPDLGPGTSGDGPLNRVRNNTAPSYLENFGYLNYRHGTENAPPFHTSWSFPHELSEVTATTLFPYLYPTNHENIIWIRNRNVLVLIDEAEHPDKDLIAFWRDCYVEKEEVTGKARCLYGAKKYSSFTWMRYLQKRELDGHDVSEHRERLKLETLNDEEIAMFVEWERKIAAATKMETEAYKLLNGREHAKIIAALKRLKSWAIEARPGLSANEAQ